MLSAQETGLDRGARGDELPTHVGSGAAEVHLVDDARRRSASRLAGREQIVTLASGLGFVAAALALRFAADAGPARRSAG